MYGKEVNSLKIMFVWIVMFTRWLLRWFEVHLKHFFLLFWPIGEEEELPDVRLRHPHLRAVGQSGHTTSKQDTTQVENKKTHKYIQVRVHFYT